MVYLICINKTLRFFTETWNRKISCSIIICWNWQISGGAIPKMILETLFAERRIIWVQKWSWAQAMTRNWIFGRLESWFMSYYTENLLSPPKNTLRIKDYTKRELKKESWKEISILTTIFRKRPRKLFLNCCSRTRKIVLLLRKYLTCLYLKNSRLRN